MIVIGVTGAPGSGKSTVAGMFGELGARVLDADRIAREMTEPGRPARREIVRAFGRAVVRPDGALDRGALASVVFGHAPKRRALEAIVHPRVMREIRRRLARLRRRRGTRAAVLDVPLLVEVGAHAWVDALVIVTAPAAVRRRRLHTQRGWSAAEVRARTAAQLDSAAKAALADAVVDNAGGIPATRRQVRRLWNRLGRNRFSSRSSTSAR
ncbi:MAG TPA: dephospho-CoA kinase [bacterium]